MNTIEDTTYHLIDKYGGEIERYHLIDDTYLLYCDDPGRGESFKSFTIVGNKHGTVQLGP